MHGLNFMSDGSEYTKAEIRVWAKYYEGLQSILHKNNDPRYFMPIIPTPDENVAVAALLAKNMILLRKAEKKPDGVELRRECWFDEVKETRSKYALELHEAVTKGKEQIQYPPALVAKWMQELARHNKSEFAQNPEMRAKYFLMAKKISKAYGTPLYTPEAKRSGGDAAIEQMRGAVLVRYAGPLAAKISRYEKKLEKHLDDADVKINVGSLDDLAAAKNELAGMICEYAWQEYATKRPMEEAKAAVREALSGTGLCADGYIETIEKTYALGANLNGKEPGRAEIKNYG